MSTYELMLSVHGSEENARLSQLEDDKNFINGLGNRCLEFIQKQMQDNISDDRLSDLAIDQWTFLAVNLEDFIYNEIMGKKSIEPVEDEDPTKIPF